jgi:hypothetical protein
MRRLNNNDDVCYSIFKTEGRQQQQVECEKLQVCNILIPVIMGMGCQDYLITSRETEGAETLFECRIVCKPYNF